MIKEMIGSWKEFSLRKRITLLIVIVAALVVAICIPASGNRRIMNIAILCFMYIGLGESWNLLSGLSGLFSIAHAIFFGLGVYGVTIMLARFGGNYFLGVLFGLFMTTIVALIVGYVGSKLSGLYFTMSLIGLQTIIYTLSMSPLLFPFTNGTQGLSMPREYLLSKPTLYFLSILLAAIMMIFYTAVRRSRWGTNMVALKENPNLSMSLGSNIVGWRIFSTVLSACMASICGAFYALYMMSNNSEVFSGTISLKIIMVVIVGGIGNVWGPVLGSVMVILDEYVRGAMPSSFSSLSVVIYALVLILMAQLKPDGLISLFKKKEKKVVLGEPTAEN